MSLTALVPDQKTYRHPSFPWLTVYPWRCPACNSYVISDAGKRALEEA